MATPLQTAHADVQAEEGAAQHHGEGSGAAAASQIQAHICGRDGRGEGNIQLISETITTIRNDLSKIDRIQNPDGMQSISKF